MVDQHQGPGYAPPAGASGRCAIVARGPRAEPCVAHGSKARRSTRDEELCQSARKHWCAPTKKLEVGRCE